MITPPFPSSAFCLLSLHPIIWLSFPYQTAFYGLPCNSCKTNTCYLAIVTNIIAHFFEAWKQKLVLYVCLFYLYFKWCNSVGFVIMLDSKFWYETFINRFKSLFMSRTGSRCIHAMLFGVIVQRSGSPYQNLIRGVWYSSLTTLTRNY